MHGVHKGKAQADAIEAEGGGVYGGPRVPKVKHMFE